MKFIGVIILCGFLSLLSLKGADAQPSAMDFGQVKIGSEVIRDFTLQNGEGKKLKISKVNSDCSCTSITSFPSELEPGKSGVIRVKFAPDKIARYDVLIAVENSGKEPLRLFRFIAKVTADGAVTSEQQQQMIIPASVLLQQISKGDAVSVIDVRPAEAYAQSHIPGSINSPLLSVRAMRMLQKSKLIIVNEMGGTSVLFSFMQILLKEGFSSVAVLDRGLRGWQMAGGKLEGANLSPEKVAEVSRLTFAQVEKENGWLIVDATKEAKTLAVSPNLKLKKLAEIQPKEIARLVQSSITEVKPQSILVLTDDGTGYAQIETLLSGKTTVPIYYLAGGRAQWLAETKRAEMMGQSRQVTVNSSANNGSNGLVKKGTGCGGCGK